MGEHKHECPRCGRPPGAAHRSGCPSSRRAQRRLNATLEDAGQPRVVYVSKGTFTATSGQEVTNPGIPYVKEGKPWYAGGVPASMRRTEDGSDAS